MFDFSGRTLFSTGANGGISRAIARTFYDLGANCVLTDIDLDGVAAFARDLDPSGARTLAVRQDAGRPEDADAALAAAGGRFGPAPCRRDFGRPLSRAHRGSED